MRPHPARRTASHRTTHHPTAQVLLPGALEDQEVDPAVDVVRGLVVARIFGLRLTVALGLEALLLDAVLDEVPLHARRAAIREVEVVGVAALLVGVALDLHELE